MTGTPVSDAASLASQRAHTSAGSGLQLDYLGLKPGTAGWEVGIQVAGEAMSQTPAARMESLCEFQAVDFKNVFQLEEEIFYV